MKIMIEVEIPDKEDCTKCQFREGFWCHLFRGHIIDVKHRQYSSCLEARRKNEV